MQQSIHDQFLEKLVAFAKTAKMGNPMSADTQIGPVTNKPQFEKILNYIDIAKGEGARAVLGGSAGDAARVRQRLVRRADDLRRREQPHAHRAGRSVRAGARR